MTRFFSLFVLLFSTQAHSQTTCTPYTSDEKDNVSSSYVCMLNYEMPEIINPLAYNELVKTEAVKNGKTRYGTASYYGKCFEGNETATGETFCHKNMTAASNSFKLNTWVRVTSLISGKSVVVRINDRMHSNMSKKGRVVDLTRRAASKLDLIDEGIAKVKVEELPKGIMQ